MAIFSALQARRPPSLVPLAQIPLINPRQA